MSDREDYFAKRSRELRANAGDVTREPLSRVSAGPRALTLTLGTGTRDPCWLELALWSAQAVQTAHGPPTERRMVERGRANLWLAELDELIDRLKEARARLLKETRR